MMVATASHGLHVGHTNVFHLCNKLHDVCRLLNGSPQLHLLGLTETRLGLHNDSQVSIPNYLFLGKNATQMGETGVGLYVHNDVKSFVTRRADLESDGVECMWVQYKRCEKDKCSLICTVYRNPSALYSWYDDFVRMMDLVTNRHPKADIILLGDFNIDLQKSHTAWESTYSLFGLKQLITQPTRVTPSSSTLIDHIYTNNTDKISGVSLSDVSISDHSPIICSWSCKSPKTIKECHTTIQYRCFKHFDKDRFLFDVSLVNFSTVYNCTDPNEAVAAWYNLFSPIVDKHAPIRRKRVKHQTLPGWLNEKIMTAMKLRDKLKKEKKFDEFRKQRNTISKMVKTAKKEYFDKMVGENCDTARLWRAMNQITRKSKRKQDSDHITASPDDLNQHFCSVSRLTSSLTSPLCPPSLSQSSRSLLSQFCEGRLTHSDSCEIPPITVPEVGKYISSLKNKKSMGMDNLSSSFLKVALEYIVEPLTYIYNLCIEFSVFPDVWKCARVVPIPKGSNTSDLDNYRPISMLSVLSKPLEKHINKNISSFMETKSLFHELQSGFRKHHSCSTAITRMCDTWLSAINNSQLAAAVFLDFRKAFDLVNHNILIDKLQIYTRSESTVSFIRSFLLNRSQRVVVNTEHSKSGWVECGVPQGSVLGPLLFCIFINDMPLHITNQAVSCDLFADDSSLHTSSSDITTAQFSLQKELNTVVKWSEDNKMIIHPQKTKSIVISTRQKHQRAPLNINLYLGTDPIEQVSSHRLLGVVIDDEMRWNLHINNVCRSVSKNLYLLSKLKYYIDASAQKMFFHAHCLSHINYASNVWSGAGEVHLKKLNSLHRRAGKIISPNPYLSTSDKLRSVNIISLEQQFNLNLAVLVYKARHGLAPKYIEGLLSSSITRYDSNKYILPRTRIDLYKSSFAFAGPSVWNTLPANVKANTSLSSFKTAVKKHFISL